jgi:hypothetical protein
MFQEYLARGVRESPCARLDELPILREVHRMLDTKFDFCSF